MLRYTTCLLIRTDTSGIMIPRINMASHNGGTPARLTCTGLSVRGSEVIFAVLLLMPAFTCPGSLKRSKNKYCLRHCLYAYNYTIGVVHLKITPSRHTLSSIYLLSFDALKNFT